MWGTLHHIPPAETRTPPFLKGHKSKHRLLILNEPPSVELLEIAVGGELEIVESFDTILYGGEETPCLVFRNKDGHTMNSWADLLWLQALIRRNGFAEAQSPNTLLGPIVIVWGDAKFMLEFGIILQKGLAPRSCSLDSLNQGEH